MRREFALPIEDVRALEALGCPWEAASLGGSPWILIHGFPVPLGYTASAARMAIRLGSYPAGGLDMAYFDPPIARSDGAPINNLSLFTLDGTTFQQWSRHYPWTPGRDTLSTHVRRVRGWLKHELRKR